MRNLDPTIKLQKELWNQLYDSMQGEVAGAIRFYSSSVAIDNSIRSREEGVMMKVGEGLLTDYYHLCMEVKEKLGMEKDIDFYISSDPEINAFSFYSQREDKPHTIEVTADLYNLLNDDEKRYIIGHEIGHLMNFDSEINNLVNYLFPDDEENSIEMPEFLQKRYDLYQNVSELGADLYGYMACENLEACVTAIYKMSSGLMLHNMDVTVDALIEDNNRRLGYFTDDNGFSFGDHPVDPIRIKVLEAFATAKTQKAYNECLDQMLTILQTFSYSEEDALKADFVVSAGLMMTNGKKGKEEMHTINYHLASYCLYPSKRFKEISKLNIEEVMVDSANKLLDDYDVSVEDLINYLLDVASSDGIWTKEELDTIYAIGEKISIEPGEMSALLGDLAVGFFKPRADLL